MSVYNGARYLGEAINSILGQTYRDFEFLIIDDGSTDDSVEIINSYKDPRIRLQQHSNRGLAESLRQGVLGARGDIIVRADQDDISYPNRIQTQINFLNINKTIGFCRSRLDWIDEHGAIFRRNWDPHDTATSARWQTLWKNIGSHASAAIRKSVLLEHNLNYRPEMNGVEDYDLWSRLLQYTHMGIIDAVLVQYRVHAKGKMRSSQSTHLLKLFSHVIGNNFLCLGITLSPQEAAAIAVLSCQTTIDPIAYSYHPLVNRLHIHEKHATTLLTKKTYHVSSPLRSEKYLSWARYMINTSRCYSFRLVVESIKITPRIFFSFRLLRIFGALVVPERLHGCLQYIDRVASRNK